MFDIVSDSDCCFSPVYSVFLLFSSPITSSIEVFTSDIISFVPVSTFVSTVTISQTEANWQQRFHVKMAITS